MDLASGCILGDCDICNHVIWEDDDWRFLGDSMVHEKCHLEELHKQAKYFNNKFGGLFMQRNMRECLSDYAHASWSGWMEYLFSKSTKNQDGTITIPADLVSRWERQVSLPYERLTEQEKDSDRAEADKMIEIFLSRMNEYVKGYFNELKKGD